MFFPKFEDVPHSFLNLAALLLQYHGYLNAKTNPWHLAFNGKKELSQNLQELKTKLKKF
jgi:hypothetical protein